jgi:hypothetical protein
MWAEDAGGSEWCTMCALFAEGAEGDALRAALYTRGCERWAFGVGDAGDDMLRAALYAGGRGR